MPYRWEKREEMANVRLQGQWGHAFWFLGAIFAIIGIIAAATDSTIGLGAQVWLLLAIFVMVAGLPFYMGLALGWYLKEKK
jgi:hypothetical protein